MNPVEIDVLRRTLIPVLDHLKLHESIREDRELLAAVERVLQWAVSTGEPSVFPRDDSKPLGGLADGE